MFLPLFVQPPAELCCVSSRIGAHTAGMRAVCSPAVLQVVRPAGALPLSVLDAHEGKTTLPVQCRPKQRRSRNPIITRPNTTRLSQPGQKGHTADRSCGQISVGETQRKRPGRERGWADYLCCALTPLFPMWILLSLHAARQRRGADPPRWSI